MQLVRHLGIMPHNLAGKSMIRLCRMQNRGGYCLQ